MEELASDHSGIVIQESAKQEKRSVHTKFKLSEEAITARDRLARHWGLTQKEVSAELVKIMDQVLSKDELRDDFVENASNHPEDPVRKTYVVSNKTRDFLERTAKELNLTRDQFFDGCLRLVHAIVQQRYKDERIEHHKELLPILDELRVHTEKVYSEVEDRIDDNDPLGGTTIFGKLKHLENIVSAIEEEIRKGEPLAADFDFWSLPSSDDFVEDPLDYHGSSDRTDGVDPRASYSSLGILKLDPEAPGDLTHTKVLETKFGEHKVFDPNWNKLLKIAHKRALEEIGSFSEVAQVTNSNIKKGKFDEKGYHPVTSGSRIPDFSIQGKKARTAWPDILNLAKYLDTDVFVRFRWHNKEKAVHPGKMGILQWKSTSEEQE